MRLQFQGFAQQDTSPAAEIMDAMNLASASTDDPHLLGYTPVARLNPYQALIYKRFPDNGFAVAPILRPDKFRDLALFSNLAASTSLHLHWNSWMTFGEADPVRARSLGMGMVGRMERFAEKGGNVVWTVHNLYPHDALHIDLELEIQQRIADLSSIVHVMSRSTVAAMDGLLRVDPSKLLYSPHPNYSGAYQDYVNRSDARLSLGIDADEVVFLLFGALKPYKGLARLYSAFERLCQQANGQRFRLVVAGAPDESIEAREFVRNCLRHPNVLIHDSRVLSERAQYFLRAADVGLVNYSRILNSGAALLYQTFGLPVIATESKTMREGLDAQCSIFVSDDSVDAFTAAMSKASQFAGDNHVRIRVLEHVATFDPSTVSGDFASQLRGRLTPVRK